MRLPDWDLRLNRLVAEAQGRRFEWGVFDCCTFAADSMVAVRGYDPMRVFRGEYRTLRQAWKILRNMDGLREAVSHCLGQPPMRNFNYCQRGDIAMVVTPRYPALAVVIGQSAMVPLSIGLQRIAMGDFICAWGTD